MDRQLFNDQLRDLLAHIFDFPILEKHPLTLLLTDNEIEGNRSKAVQEIIHNCIDQLKPEGTVPRIETVEWRYYLILHGRYIQGLSTGELKNQLSLGERQLRRLHIRAVEALGNLLWARILSTSSEQSHLPIPTSGERYPVQLKPYDLHRIVEEVVGLCRPRATTQRLIFEVDFSKELPLVNTDRVLIRQVLLSMINIIMAEKQDDTISITTAVQNNRVILDVSTACSDLQALKMEGSFSGKVDPYWLQQLGTSLEFIHMPPIEPNTPCLLRLSIPIANYRTIFVIDDQGPVIRMIQRYLTGTPCMVEGSTSPNDILMMIRERQPDCVLLDVMMPGLDGWEVLQAMKSDPETNHIPVIICSVWNEPEMAFSLGATGYLKKPFSQADLLSALQHAGVVGYTG